MSIISAFPSGGALLLSATLTAAGWSATAPYTQTVAVAGVLAADNPIVDLNMSGATVDTASALQENWACVGRLAAGAGTLTAYCYEEKPEVDLPMTIKAVR